MNNQFHTEIADGLLEKVEVGVCHYPCRRIDLSFEVIECFNHMFVHHPVVCACFRGTTAFGRCGGVFGRLGEGEGEHRLPGGGVLPFGRIFFIHHRSWTRCSVFFFIGHFCISLSSLVCVDEM